MPNDFSSDLDAASGGSQGSVAMVAVPTRVPHVPVPTWAFGPPAVPEIVNAKPGPMELMHALRRRWMTAVGLGLLVGGTLSAMVWYFLPVRYEVVALLRVLSTRPKVLEKEGLGGADGDYAVYKRTQAALFKSNFVLQATLRKPEVKRLFLIQHNKDDILDFLSNEISVDYPGDSEIMRVSMKGDRPDELRTIINSVKESYMDEIVNAERMERLRQRDMLERFYKKNREDIRNRLDALHKLNKEYSTSGDNEARIKLDLAFRRLNSLVERQEGLQHQIGEVEMRILLLTTRASLADDIEIPDFIIDHQLGSDVQMGQLKQALADYTAALTEEKRRTNNPKSPSVMRMRQQMNFIEEQLDARREELRPVLIELFRYSTQGEKPEQFIPLLETERERLAAHLEEVNQKVQQHLEEMQKLNKFSVQIESLGAELKEVQDVTAKMGNELKLWAVEIDAQPRVQSIEDASIPSGNDAIRKYVAVGFAGATGFAAVLFFVSILEFQSRRLNSEREISEGLGIRVIGHLPPLSGRAWRMLANPSSAAGAHLQSLLTESVDSIRTTLVHSNGANPPRVVMVSSSDIQEGKTTVASQLAASLARAGRRTVLLDGDLRNPTAHVVFGLPLGPGFADVLRGDAEGEAALYATSAPNLWLMPAGQFDAAAVQALAGEALVKIIKSLKDQYDFVIVDAPPVLKVADPLIFGQCVDAAVISVRRDVSQIPKILEACENLRAVGVKVLGAIVNGVKEKPMKRSAPIQPQS